MISKSKSNSGRPYIAIWLIHIIVYYFIYLTIREFVQNYYLGWDYFSKQSLLIIFFSPFLGLFSVSSYFELIVGLAILPLPLMYYFYKRVFKYNLFKSFVVSILVVYILDYIYLVIIGYHKYDIPFSMGEDKINTLFFMIPALSMSISVNYLIFKKTYKRLEMENETLNGKTDAK